jgi:hypothetical protein
MLKESEDVGVVELDGLRPAGFAKRCSVDALGDGRASGIAYYTLSNSLLEGKHHFLCLSGARPEHVQPSVLPKLSLRALYLRYDLIPIIFDIFISLPYDLVLQLAYTRPKISERKRAPIVEFFAWLLRTKGFELCTKRGEQVGRGLKERVEGY